MIKLPRTLHIEGSRMPRGKTDPEAIPFNKLKGEFLVIEEKLDGSGVSIFLDNNLNLQIWHRGSEASGKEFKPLHDWSNKYYEELFNLLNERYIMFGEWMYVKHTIYYDKLPCLFFESDIYDKEENIFLSTKARQDLIKSYSFIVSVPILKSFKPNQLIQLTELISTPHFQSDKWTDFLKWHCNNHKFNYEKAMHETDQSGLMEGLYIKHEDQNKILGRYKYVRFEFVQNILDSGTHLMDRLPIFNSLSDLDLVQDYWR